MKSNKGITLIALIITIVVLLILAVVAIGAAQDSNIVGYAQNAAGQYEEGKGLENNAIAGYENLLSQYANGVVPEENGGGDNSSVEDNIPEENNPNPENPDENNSPINYLGKYVKYDANGNGSVEDETILWRVLRNDADKVELITADVLGNVELITTDFNEARSIYNGAVSAMVSECVRVTGISSVRNVGGPAIDTTTETVNFRELVRTTEFNPSVDIANFEKYEGENGLKVGDNNYEEDLSQMTIAGVTKADNAQSYILSSRIAEVTGSTSIGFDIRKISDDNGPVMAQSSIGICNIMYNDTAFGSYAVNDSIGIRPILTLEAGILDGKAGVGTNTQPIEIY